jgi:hypothetical protein
VRGHRAARIDPPALFAALIAAIAERIELAPERLRRDLGVDAVADVAAHLGDGSLLFWRNDPDALPTGDRSMFGNAVLLLPVRDGDALQRGLQQLLPRLGAVPMVDDHGWLRAEWSATPHRAVVEVGAGFACLAFGPGADSALDAVFARAAAGRPYRAADSAAVRRASGSGEFEVGDLVAQQLGNVLLFASALVGAPFGLPDRRDLESGVQAWLPLFERNGLLRATTTEHVDSGRWSCQLSW